MSLRKPFDKAGFEAFLNESDTVDSVDVTRSLPAGDSNSNLMAFSSVYSF